MSARAFRPAPRLALLAAVALAAWGASPARGATFACLTPPLGPDDPAVCGALSDLYNGCGGPLWYFGSFPNVGQHTGGWNAAAAGTPTDYCGLPNNGLRACKAVTNQYTALCVRARPPPRPPPPQPPAPGPA